MGQKKSENSMANVSGGKDKINILIADDHPVVRKGLHSCLAKQDRLKIVAEAADGDEALRKTHELVPDVVLLDISMPRMNGLAVTEALRKDMPQVKILILSVHSNKEYVFRIIQAGAHGYISKEATPEELLGAIETVYAGEPFFSPEIARAALNQLVSSGGQKDPFAQLTEREREVLTLIASGRSNKEIAQRLGIGVRTIETHRERIMRRLNIHSVAGLTKFAIANGLVTLEGEAPPA
ncbi:MAG: DNA-binding response regulator [Verrucomicrobia bacterium]|nr:MAG: DNA-binding response regulator [Verrucomicrobiota bacterium]